MKLELNTYSSPYYHFEEKYEVSWLFLLWLFVIDVILNYIL